MQIKVYGPGCARCKQTEKVVLDTLAETGVQADFQKVEDVQAMAKAGVLSTPAVEVDGKVVIAGRVPAKEEIRRLIGA